MKEKFNVKAVIIIIAVVVLLIALLRPSDNNSNNSVSDNNNTTTEEHNDKYMCPHCGSYGLTDDSDVCSYCGWRKDTDKDIDKEPVEEEVPEVPEPQEEEEPKQKTLSEQVELAKIFVDQCAKEGFAAEDYKIDANTETGSIVLTTNMDISIVQEGMNNPEEWKNLVDTMIQTNNSLSDNVKKLGCSDVTISIVAGDFSLDKAYLVVRDGVVLYDCVNNINVIGL